MEALNERIVVLEVENNQLKQLIVILEQLSIDLMPIVMKCKCDYNSIKVKTKLNVLKQKYDYLKQNNNNPNNSNSVQIIDKIKKCSKILPKIVIKKVDNFEEILNFNEEINGLVDDKCLNNRRRRGRPPKRTYDLTEELTEQMDQTFDDKIESSDVLRKRRVNLNKENGNKIRNKYNKIRSNIDISTNSSLYRVNREKINKKRNESQVLCEECGKRFRDTYEMKFHMWRHTGHKLFRCSWPGCGKEFSSKYLTKHQKTHSNPKRFLCQFIQCNQSFESSEQLSQHFGCAHDGHKPFKCDFMGCDQEFSAKANLLQHHNWRHSTTSFACSWPGCDDAFKRKHLLTEHMNTKHIGKIKYRCEWPGCDFKSSHSKSFARHKLIHSGEKPYPCSWDGCEWRFRQPHQLKAHMLTHTGESPVVCEAEGCDQRFKTRRVMLSHLQKFHTFNQRLNH